MRLVWKAKIFAPTAAGGTENNRRLRCIQCTVMLLSVKYQEISTHECNLHIVCGATYHFCIFNGWWSGVVVSALALINEVNQRRARLVLRWATVSGFNSRCRTFISECNQPATQGQLSRPSLWGR